MLNSLVLDIRHARRSLARTRATTIAAIACLAGAIGAATAVFTILEEVVLRELPFRNADRLVAIWGVNPSRDAVVRGFSWPDVQDIARGGGSLETAAAMANAASGMTLTGHGDPAQIPVRFVSGNFFQVLGADPAAGRTLSVEDDRVGSTAVVMLSDSIWRERFGSDPAVVGKPITLDGRPYVVCGIAPPSFDFPAGVQLWATIAHAVPEYAGNRDVAWLELIGLARPGVTPAQVRGDVAVAVEELRAKLHPNRPAEDLSVVPLRNEILGDTRPALWALMAAVLLLLAIACANVGGLLLLRIAGSARDIAVRMAIGARRIDIVRQSSVEALMLAGAGGAFGLALSAFLVGLARRLAPAGIPGIDSAQIDWRVLAFAIAAVTVSALACGVVPAFQASSAGVAAALQRGGRGVAGERALLRRGLAAAEVALALVLIVSAVLIGRTFLNLRSVDVGFNAERVLAFDVPQPPDRYPDSAASLAFANRLLPRLESLPAVRSAASVLLRPLWGEIGMDWPVVIEGQPPAEAALNPLVNLEAVTPGYFATMGIPMLDGRDIRDDDREGRDGAAVVSRSFAQRFWPGANAIGKRLQFPLPGSPYHRQFFTVVGIAGDAKYRGLRGSRFDLYISAAQCPYAVHQFVVRSDGDPGALANAIRAEVRALDPSLPLDDVVTLSDAVDEQVAHPRFTAMVFAAFAATATGLAALGLGTLVAWQVRQRTRELGIRIALGARAGHVQRLVLGEVAWIVGAGVVAGLAVAFGVSQFLRSLLFEVPPRDPVTFALALVIAVAIGLGSAYFPARRATRVDPLVALRTE